MKGVFALPTARLLAFLAPRSKELPGVYEERYVRS